jgi:hypothetical protein
MGPWFSPFRADKLDSSSPASKLSGSDKADLNENPLSRHDRVSICKPSFLSHFDNIAQLGQLT